MLYQAAIGALGKAREALLAGDIAARTRHAGRVQQILIELVGALDPGPAPELAERLLVIYDYVLHLVQRGQYQQSDAPFVEAEQLLALLLDAWERCEPVPYPRAS